MSILRKHSWLFFFLGLALVIRFLLAIVMLQPGYLVNDDLNRYGDWGRIVNQYGASSSYTMQHISFGLNPNNQPPGTEYVYAAMYSLATTYFHIFGGSLMHVYNIFLKLPSIIADLLIGSFIYICVRRKATQKMALAASALFLFNPSVIYNSAIWGQSDALDNAFFYASLLSFFNRKYFLSVVAFFFSLYIKISLLPLLPLLLFFILKETKYAFGKVIVYLVSAAAIIVVMTFPVSFTPWTWLSNFFLHNSGGELPYIANYSFNFWTVIYNPDIFSLLPKSDAIVWALPLSVWGQLLFALFYVPLFVAIIRQKKTEMSFVFAIMLLAAFALYMFYPRMHQRYLYPVFPLLATYIGYVGLQKKWYIPYLLLTIVNFFNLYVVWHPSNFMPGFISAIIVHSKVRWGMSWTLLVLFLYIYYEMFFRKFLKKL